MKTIKIVLAAMISLPGLCRAGSSSRYENVLRELDDAIASVATIDSAYIHDINAIKARLHSAGDDREEQYRLNGKLFRRYRFFQADSALRYANRNLNIALQMADPELIWESAIQRADVLARSGMFMEAARVVEGVTVPLPDHMRTDYYTVISNICQFASEYVTDPEYSADYFNRKMECADSIIALASPDSFDYRSTYANMLIEKYGSPEYAVDYINDVLTYYKPGQREYSVLISQQAYAYRELGDKDLEGEALARSAISDIYGCVKENMAVRMLSNIMLDNGDIERAKNYLDKSFVDANFYSARMRNTQSAAMLPLVTDAYEHLQADRQRLSWLIVILLGCVVAVIAVSYMLIHRKNRALAVRNDELTKAQTRLSDANNNLNEALTQLEQTNRRISEQAEMLEKSNATTQSYLSEFIWLCSSTINKMSAYRNKLNLMFKAKNTDKLKEALNSAKDITDISTDFYKAFDEAFLAINPDFISRLNDLLAEPMTKCPVHGERLSTEQRIYALISLGIADNQRIADFLHCTLSTVYTYRSKVKARAKNPATFETDIARK